MLWPTALAVLALSIPLTYALAAVFRSDVRPFRAASAATGFALFGSLTLACAWAVLMGGAERVLSVPLGKLALTFRLDVATALVLVLVNFVAFVIARYSRSYLHGEEGQARYVRWLLSTLLAVSTLVLSNNLLLLALAWMGTSLSLHQLLTFYASRPQAQIAAHKKFLASRVADASLLGAFALIGAQVGSLELTLLFALQVVLQTRPESALAHALYPQLFAGFYLDEAFTRLTFRIWPPKRLPRSAQAHSAHVVGIQEG